MKFNPELNANTPVERSTNVHETWEELARKNAEDVETAKRKFIENNLRDQNLDLEERAAEILKTFKNLLSLPGNKVDWLVIEHAFLKSIEPDEVFKKTNLAAAMHEELLAYKPSDYEGGNPCDVARIILTLAGENPDNFNYLKSVFLKQKVPEVALYDLRRSDPNELFIESYYYETLLEIMEKMSSPAATRFIETMLLEIDNQNNAYLEKNHGSVNDEDDRAKVARAEQKLKQYADLYRSYEYTADFESYTVYRTLDNTTLNHLRPHKINTFEIDTTLYKKFFGKILDEVDGHIRQLIYEINPRIIESILELQKLGEYDGLSPLETVEILKGGFLTREERDLLDEYEGGSSSWELGLEFEYEISICKNFKVRAIDILRKIGDSNSIEALKQFVAQQGETAPVFFDILLDTFRKIDQEKSISVLLELTKTGNELEKNIALALLYRIEPEEMQISRNGLQYLQKIFDVGKYNDEKYLAQRITSRGQVGIFEKNGKKFCKYFNIGGLGEEKMEIQAKLMDLTYATLFTPRENETADERAEREFFLSEFQEKYFGFLNGEFFDLAGIRFNDLSFAEQAQFIKFYTNSTEEIKNETVKFCRQFGLNALRAFLSIDYKNDMGEHILKIANSYKPEIAERIFDKYAEIINSAERAEELIQKLYSRNTPTRVHGYVRNILMEKGALLLAQVGSHIQKQQALSEYELIRELESLKMETLILGSSYVELYKEKVNVPIEDIVNTSVEQIPVKDLSEKEKRELLEVYKKGRPRETYENEAHLRLLLEEFEQTLEDKNTLIFNVRFEGEIVAFATFRQEDKDTLNIGGLTFIEDIRNPAIAVAVMNSIMKQLGKFNIKALVHSKNKILPMYQKRFGFKIVGELPLEENAGELYYEIERQKDTGNQEELKPAA